MITKPLKTQNNPEHPKKSSSRSETGHAKNLANFNKLISYVITYETAYNPSKTSIKLTALQTLAADAQNAINNVNSALPPYTNAVATRNAAFAPLSKLTTRIMNAIKATDTTPQVNDNVKTLIRKIQGKRATAKTTENNKTTAKAQSKETKEISASQMSYDNRLNNLHKLIKLLATIPLYTPNENELKLTTLATLHNNLKTMQTTVINTATSLSNARIARNTLLYKENTGLVHTALSTKTYIKSLYGSTSPQYKQIAKILFKIIKI